MERFSLEYVITPSNGVYGVDACIHNETEDSFTADEICDAFVQFMVSAGFSADYVYDYFSAK